MNLLLDNSVLIAAIPETGSVDEEKSKLARRLIQLANQHGHTTYIHHKAMERDVRNSPNKTWRSRIVDNFPPLPDPPEIQNEIKELFGDPDPSTNDWSDYLLLAAAYAHAVNKLVTEDKGILRKAQHLGLGEQVVSVEDAIADILARAPRESDAALLPNETKAHTLDPKDPIFDTLRADYPGFDSWLRKCQEEQRVCWVIKVDGKLGGLAIVKDQSPGEHGITGKTLKICTFKVSEDCPGMRYGELLLKSVFDYAYANGFESSFLTVLPKHDQVVAFSENFGFCDNERRTGLGEMVLAKDFIPPDDRRVGNLDALEYHRLYGPKRYQLDAPRYIIPIKPEWRKILFPEASEQLQFQATGIMAPSGNSIQKAYLSRSRIKGIEAGAILYFYESHHRRRIVAIGIAEGTRSFRDAEQIADFVGKRTVYTLGQINAMTQNGDKPVLAILFRQADTPKPGPTYQDLQEAEVWKAAPQSIMSLRTSAAEWMRTQVDMTRQR